MFIELHIYYVHFLHDFASLSDFDLHFYCQVFMMVVGQVMVFFYVFALCSGCMFQHMGGTYSLHFQGDRSSSSGCRSYMEKGMCCLCRTV